MKTKSVLWYTIYSIISTILQEAALAAFVLWGLPYFDIYLPWWGLAMLMIALAVYACVAYRIGKPTLTMKPLVSLETMTGSEGKVVTPLAPEGYVKVKGELWKASSTESELKVGDEVVVVGIDGLKLIVNRKER